MLKLKSKAKGGHRRRYPSKINILDQNSPDGGSFDLMPSLRIAPHQNTYCFSIVVPAWKRFGMTVGASEILSYDNFKLSDIPTYTVFTQLFDQYRIKQVQVLFKAVGTQTYIGNSSGDIPQVSTAFDYNDGSGNGAHPRGYQSCLTTLATCSFNRKFTPRTATQLYLSGTSSGYRAGNPNDWLDCAYPGIPHYQLVTNITTTSLDCQFVYDVDVVYTLEFKTVRFYSATSEVSRSSGPQEENGVELHPPTPSATLGGASGGEVVSRKPMGFLTTKPPDPPVSRSPRSLIR